MTILEISFFKSLSPKIIKYSNYKSFNEDEFQCLFKKLLDEVNTYAITMNIFKMRFLNALNKLVLLKKKASAS